MYDFQRTFLGIPDHLQCIVGLLLSCSPPGALIDTPRAPSAVGPRDDQVYMLCGTFSLSEYSAAIISGDTYAPTPVN